MELTNNKKGYSGFGKFLNTTKSKKAEE